METTINIEAIKLQVLSLIDNRLKGTGFVYGVNICKWGFSGSYLQIYIACSDVNINGVRGQKPQIVSLALSIDTMELEAVAFGGNGGRSIYRKPNLLDASEKYLAMKSVKIPFTRPKKELKFVLNAIDKFILNYIKVLKENKDVLTDSNIVNYNELLTNL